MGSHAIAVNVYIFTLLTEIKMLFMMQILINLSIGYNVLAYVVAMHWFLTPEPPKEAQLVPFVEDLLGSDDYLRASDSTAWLRQQLVLSEERT